MRKGFISKHSVIHEGKSVIIDIPEIDFGFQPELLQELPATRKSDVDVSEILTGVDSISFINERIVELRRLISSGKAEERWKLFAQGLKLSSKIDLDTLELLDASLFYIPYYIAKLCRDSESRYLTWDRSGKEDSRLTLELMSNPRFRDLVENQLTA